MARNSLKNICRLIEAVKTELPVEQDFLNDLKRSIEMSDAKNSRKPSMSYKPSSMNCIRNMYYQRIGAEQDESSKNYAGIGICNSGSDTHVRIQTAVMDMLKNGMQCEWVNIPEFIKSRELDYLTVKEQSKAGTETKLYHNTLNMSFMCDGIISYKNRYYILEIKTENSNKFFSRTGVNPDHYNQAIAYSLSFKIPEVLFVYISRDTLDMKCFLYKVTDDMQHELSAKIMDCEEYVKNLIAPPKPADISKKSCEYCSYKSKCRKDG